jgi:hypothetical protein
MRRCAAVSAGSVLGGQASGVLSSINQNAPPAAVLAPIAMQPAPAE